jgi:hypothetical protein
MRRLPTRRPCSNLMTIERADACPFGRPAMARSGAESRPLAVRGRGHRARRQGADRAGRDPFDLNGGDKGFGRERPWHLIPSRERATTILLGSAARDLRTPPILREAFGCLRRDIGWFSRRVLNAVNALGRATIGEGPHWAAPGEMASLVTAGQRPGPADFRNQGRRADHIAIVAPTRRWPNRRQASCRHGA